MNRNVPSLYGEDYYARYIGGGLLKHTLLAGICMELKPVSVLDVGCGYAETVGMLKSYGINAVGIDFSRTSSADVIANATDLPFRDNYFDVVVSADLLEHIETSDVPAVIGEMGRVGKQQVHHIALTEHPLIGEEVDRYHLTLKPAIWWESEFNKAGWASHTELELSAIEPPAFTPTASSHFSLLSFWCYGSMTCDT